MPGKHKNLIPLRIRAKLASPVVAPLGLPLEGILRYAGAFQQHGGDISRIAPTGQHYRLPLKAAGNPRKAGMWFYNASMAQAEGIESQVSIQRQLNLTAVRELTNENRVISKTFGWAKDVSKPLFAFAPTDWVLTWYCVGNRMRILELLELISGVGKKRNIGFGWVKDWEVEPCNKDYSLFGPSGKLMRALPTWFFNEGTAPRDDATKMLFAYRTPAWKSENQAVCLVPRDYGLRSISTAEEQLA